MRPLFIVCAKLVGIFWTAFSLALLVGMGLLLLSQNPDHSQLAGDLAYRFLFFITLFLQLSLALSLMLGTELWAVLLGIPNDTADSGVTDINLLLLGTKLIGIYFVVQATPALATEILVMVNPATPPMTGILDLVPMIQPGLTILIGLLCSLQTPAVLRLVTKMGPHSPTEPSQESSADGA